MTRLFFEMDPEEALYDRACQYPGSVEALADRLNKNRKVFRNKLCPGGESKKNEPTVKEFRRSLECLRQARVERWNQPLLALNWQLNHACFELPEVDEEISDEELTAEICRVVNKFSNMTTSVGAALADRRVTDRELDGVDKATSELVSAALKLRARVERRHEECNEAPFNLAQRPKV